MPNEHKLTVLSLPTSEATPEGKESLRQSFNRTSANSGSTLMWTLSGLVLAACGGGASSTSPNRVVIDSKYIEDGAEVVLRGEAGGGGATVTTTSIAAGTNVLVTTVQNDVASVDFEHSQESIAVQVPRVVGGEVAVGGASPESSVYRPRMGDDATDGRVFITPLTEVLWNTPEGSQQRVLDNIFGGAVSLGDILNGGNYMDASRYSTDSLVSELITQASLAVMAIKKDNSLGTELNGNPGGSPGTAASGNGRGDEPEGPNSYITKLENLFAGFRARNNDNDQNNDGLTLNGGSLKDAVVAQIGGVASDKFTITVTDGAVLGAVVYSDTDADGVLDLPDYNQNNPLPRDEDLTFFAFPTPVQAQVIARTDDHGQITVASSFPYDTAPFLAQVEGAVDVTTGATFTSPQAWRSFYVRQGNSDSDRDQLDRDGDIIITPLTDMLSRLAAEPNAHQNIQRYLDTIFGGNGIIRIEHVLNKDNYDIDSSDSVAVLITTASLALTEIARRPELASDIDGITEAEETAINNATGHQKGYLALQQLFSKTNIKHDNIFTGENLREVVTTTNTAEQNEGGLLTNILLRLDGLFGYSTPTSTEPDVGTPLAGTIFIGATEHDNDPSNNIDYADQPDNQPIDEVIFDFGAYLTSAKAAQTQTAEEYYKAAATLFGFADPYGNFDGGVQTATPSTSPDGGYDTFEGIFISNTAHQRVQLHYREGTTITRLEADKPNDLVDDPAPPDVGDIPGLPHYYVSLENIRNLVIVTDSNVNDSNGVFKLTYAVWDGDEISTTYALSTITVRISALNDGIIKNPLIGEPGGSHLETALQVTEGGSTNTFRLEELRNSATNQLENFFYDPVEGDDVSYRAVLVDENAEEVALHSWISINRNTGAITVRGDHRDIEPGVYTIRVYATDGIPVSADPADIVEPYQDFTLTVHNTDNYRPQIIEGLSETALPITMTRLTSQLQATSFELESRGGPHGNYFTDQDIGTFMIEDAETNGVALHSGFTHRIAASETDDMGTPETSDDVTTTYGYLYFNADGTNGGFAGDYEFDITDAAAINALDSGENPRFSFKVVNTNADNRLPSDRRYEVEDDFTIQLRGTTSTTEGDLTDVAATSTNSARITITDTSAIDTVANFEAQTLELLGRFSSLSQFNVLEDLSYEMVVLDSEGMDITNDADWVSIDLDTGTINFAENIPDEVAGTAPTGNGNHETTYTLRVTARDEAGVPTEPLDFTLTVRANRAPEINELLRSEDLPDRIANITTNGTFALEGRGDANLNYFDDPDGEIASYSLERVLNNVAEAAPSWISVNNNGLITLTNGTPGNYTIRVTATDNGDGAGEGYGAESNFIDFALEVI